MERRYEALRLKNQLCFPIYLCSKELVRRYTPYLDGLGLTYTQYIVMMYFWEMGGGTAKEVGRTLLLDPSTLTPLLRRLEAKGYITRRRSELDERSVIIEPTEEGLALRDKALEIPGKIGACLALSEDEAAQLYTLACKALINIEKELDND